MKSTASFLFTSLFLASLCACPEGGGEESDAATASDAGGGDDAAQAQDAGSTDQATPTPDAAQGDAARPDATVVMAQEVTLGYDDGLPAIKLVADPLAEGRLLVTPDPSLRPVEVRRVRFIPTAAYSATLRVTADQLGGPGTILATREFTVEASDVDQWFEVDLSDLGLQVDGPFWIVTVYPSTLTAAQEVMYGASSSSGQCYYYKLGYPPYMVNFDQIMRVVVGTPSTTPGDAPGPDGADCDAALDCTSGYCSGGRCSITCSGGDCGAGRSCLTLASGDQACVTDCTTSADCATSAFCLSDTTLLDPAGFCVAGGPLTDGSDCQYHYHTICEHGHCSACDSDPEGCADPGTCSAP